MLTTVALLALLCGHVNFSTSLRGGVSISLQDVMGPQGLILYVQIEFDKLLPGHASPE